MSKKHEQTLFQRRHPDGQQTHENMLNITHHQGNTNQNHNEIPPHAGRSEWLKLTTQETIDIGKDGEKEEPFCIAGRNANWCSHSRKVWSFLKKLIIVLLYDPVISLLGVYPKDTKMLI